MTHGDQSRQADLSSKEIKIFTCEAEEEPHAAWCSIAEQIHGQHPGVQEFPLPLSGGKAIKLNSAKKQKKKPFKF